MSKIEQIVQEVKNCKEDFEYFATKYLKIVDKNGELVPLVLNNAQRTINNELQNSNYIKILKARQLGSTTFIAARFFWEALFYPNTRIAVVAHTSIAVKSIFSIYQRYYDNLPKFLKVERTKASVNEMEFVHGGFIKVDTANSQNFRGSTFSRIHASEAAFWQDMNSTIQALFQTASNNSQIILETTPNGLNEFYLFWKDDNAFTKLFLSWLDHEEYRVKRNPRIKETDTIKEFLAECKLTKQQKYWFLRTLKVKCANNLLTFKQEYPVFEKDAFLGSGSFVFPRIAANLAPPPEKFGWMVFQAPHRYATYVMGVDTASGSPNGDFSAIAILDVTNKDKPLLVATYYDRVSLKEFSRQVKNILNKYQALVVVERNSYGQAIAEDLAQTGYPYLYRDTKFDKLTNRFTDKIGFYTGQATRAVLISRLISAIADKQMSVPCPRLQYEFTNFIYNEKGKPEAEGGFHDDLVISVGLALMGEDQVAFLEEEVKLQKRPRNTREMVEFEAKYGCSYKNVPNGYWAEEKSLFDKELSSISEVY